MARKRPSVFSDFSRPRGVAAASDVSFPFVSGVTDMARKRPSVFSDFSTTRGVAVPSFSVLASPCFRSSPNSVGTVFRALALSGSIERFWSVWLRLGAPLFITFNLVSDPLSDPGNFFPSTTRSFPDPSPVFPSKTRKGPEVFPALANPSFAPSLMSSDSVSPFASFFRSSDSASPFSPFFRSTLDSPEDPGWDCCSFATSAKVEEKSFSSRPCSWPSSISPLLCPSFLEGIAFWLSIIRRFVCMVQFPLLFQLSLNRWWDLFATCMPNRLTIKSVEQAPSYSTLFIRHN